MSRSSYEVCGGSRGCRGCQGHFSRSWGRFRRAPEGCPRGILEVSWPRGLRGVTGVLQEVLRSPEVPGSLRGFQGVSGTLQRVPGRFTAVLWCFRKSKEIQGVFSEGFRGFPELFGGALGVPGTLLDVLRVFCGTSRTFQGIPRSFWEGPAGLMLIKRS